MIEENSINELLYVLECMGLSPCIIYNKLVIFRGEEIVFAKEVEKLFINDLVDLGINVCNDSYVYYLLYIAKHPDCMSKNSGMKKSLTL